MEPGVVPNEAAFRSALTDALLVNTHMSLWDMIRRTAERHPDRPAVVMDGDAISFAELVERALRCAGQLQQLGVGRGTRVAVLMPVCPEWAVLHYAILRLGAVVAPVSWAIEGAELRHVLTRSRAAVLVAMDIFKGVDYVARLAKLGVSAGGPSAASRTLRRVVVLPMDEDARRPAPQTAPYREVFGGPDSQQLNQRGVARSHDTAYIVHTSGSMAAPKPAVCTHGSIMGAATGCGMSLTLGPEDRWLSMQPTFHIGGVTQALTAPHIVGAAVHMVGAFDAGRAVRALAEARCTATAGFDTNFTLMMAHSTYSPAACSSLRKLAAACSPNYLRRLMATWNFEIVTPCYGSTESSGVVAMVPPTESDQTIRLESVGRPLPGVDLVIVDPETGQRCGPLERGEICFRGWNRIARYDGSSPLNLSAIDDEGYFHTQDQGWLDERGYLYYTGRYKAMIKTGGENVSEREVELLLEAALPSLELAQVVGVPDDVWGEAIVAFVELSSAEPVPSSAELRDLCRGNMASFKIPTVFHVLERSAWPTMPNGKPDRNELRRLAVARRSTGGSEADE